jgi:gamma-glutamyltranspeptidase/glutathione hydrolase
MRNRCKGANIMSQLPYNRRSFLTIAGSALAAAAAERTIGADLTSKGHGLVVGYPEAAEAGMNVLADGGNAVDAVVAASLAAGVVAVSRCGIGGYGGHMSIGLPSGKVTCIDFNSEAPAAARADMFPLDAKGNVKGGVNKHGWLAAGVPATMAGLQLALDKYGTRPLARVVGPAIRYARDGFAVYWPYGGAASNLLRDPGSARLFSRNGKLLKKGDTYRNPDLADLLQNLAEKGSAYELYRGEVGRRIADAFRKNGGLVTAEDLATYRPREVEPLQLDWHRYTIATAPLTAGGLTILQTIAALKALGGNWERLARNSPTRTQAWLEALRISWGDRLRMFGDSRHVDVPVERLLSEKYAQESAKGIQLAIDQKRPVRVSTDGRTASGTVHLSAVDGAGMMACVTLTHGDSFGAQVTVDGLGLLLGHGMSRFDPVPGRPNSIAAGKRPLDNMSPTIVLRNGKPVLAIGAAGGRRIPNGIFGVLLNLIIDGRSLEAAVTEPRLHTEGGLSVYAERGRPEAEIQYLKRIGYTIAGPQQCYVAAVQIDPAKKNGRVVGVADVPPQNGPGVRNPHPVVTSAG